MNMKNRTSKGNKGFSLAEMMLVVAITGILATVGIFSLTHYLRVLKHLEYDETAKEIFIAAQNHLSMANNEGYLGAKSFGVKEGLRTKQVETDGTTEEVELGYTSVDSNIYYYVVNNGNVSGEKPLFDLILPFGSIDETVRKEGSYIIRYDKEAAQVLDVFYSEKSGTRYGHSFADLYAEVCSDGVTLLMEARGKEDKDKRRNYIDGSIVGYYGGVEANPGNAPKNVLPFIKVENAEELKVIVKPNGYINETAGLFTGESQRTDYIKNNVGM